MSYREHYRIPTRRPSALRVVVAWIIAGACYAGIGVLLAWRG